MYLSEIGHHCLSFGLNQARRGNDDVILEEPLEARQTELLSVERAAQDRDAVVEATRHVALAPRSVALAKQVRSLHEMCVSTTRQPTKLMFFLRSH